MSDAPHGSEPVPPGDYYPEITSEARNWGMLCHLIALLAMPSGFGHIVGPLVVWLIKKDDDPFIDENGKESLNFQISVTLYSLLLAITCIGIALLPFVLVANIVLVIMASMKASRGEAYRYPLTIRFIS